MAGLIGKKELAWMKNDAILIAGAGGGFIDEAVANEKKAYKQRGSVCKKRCLGEKQLKVNSKVLSPSAPDRAFSSNTALLTKTKRFFVCKNWQLIT